MMRTFFSFAALVLLAVCMQVGVAQAQASAPSAPKAVLLLAESNGESGTVSFGKSGVSGSEAGRQLKAQLEKLGVVFVSTSGVTPLVGERLPGLPLGDQAAANLARQVGARLAVNVGIVGRSEGPIRATSLVGQAVEVRIRVLDLGTGEAIFDKQLRHAGYGSDAAVAHKLASERALGKLLPALSASVSSRLPREATSDRGMSIQIRGAQGWREVAAILSRLASTQGTEAVHAIEIREDLVHLRVQSALSAASLVSSLRRTRIPNGSLAVIARGNDIAIELTITNPNQPLING